MKEYNEIRANFENHMLNIAPTCNLSRVANGEYDDMWLNTRFDGYKACAESYEKKLSEANARNAMLVEALKDADTNLHEFGLHEISKSRSRILQAISANSEAVAAWEAEKLEPLRREVAMTRNALAYHQRMTRPIESSMDALLNTQETAEAFEREVAAKALEELACTMLEVNEGKLSAFMEVQDFIVTLNTSAAELRANKVKGE